MSTSNVADESKTASASPRLLQDILMQYRGANGSYDEALVRDDELRPGWKRLFDKLGKLPVDELERRSANAQRQLHVDGAAFNPHEGDEPTRPWSLDPVPLVLQQQEWAQVDAGLQQRAKLADLILLDLLGPQTLLQEKVLPPEVLFANPRYYPAYHSLVPRPQKHLQLYAADLTRSSDGRWWVTADRTRSPFGLGYVLENRLIASRMLPDAFANCHVRRLAPFFMTMQSTLKSLANRYRENPRIAIWSKGPKSRAYFEDAFLARYLGYTLVEGDDLAVRDNRVMLKTLGGLLPVEVLLRRVEDHNCDSSELERGSRLGVAGLLEVVRSGNVALGNSIGSCLAESPILLSFLPSVCRHLLGQDLLLPSVATWWCGDQRALQYVTENLEKLVIRSAFRPDRETPIHPARMSKEEQTQLVARLRSNPSMFVGQEVVARSTTPVWEDGQLKPWSLAMRAFLVSKEDSYQTLPGALARVAPDPDVLLRNMTSGEKSQDVWIMDEKPVEAVSLLRIVGSTVDLKRGGAELPSRAADNLFWLGRNLERAEQLARLARITLQQITSQEATDDALQLLTKACEESKQLKAKPSSETTDGDSPLAKRLSEGVLDSSSSYSLRNVVISAEATAMRVRDRISIDHLRVISDLREMIDIDLPYDEVSATELMGKLDAAIIQLNALSGLSCENMTRTLGWTFLDLGRRIERAFQTARTVSQLISPRVDENGLTRALELVLQIHDSYMTYRNRYLANIQTAAVLDLLLTDETNPRSILFQLQTIGEHVDRFPRPEGQAVISTEQRIALAQVNAMRLVDIFEVSAVDKRGEFSALHKLLARVQEQLPKLSDAISAKFLIHVGFQRHYARDGKGGIMNELADEAPNGKLHPVKRAGEDKLNRRSVEDHDDMRALDRPESQ